MLWKGSQGFTLVLSSTIYMQSRFFSVVSQELSEIILTMITNASPFLKQYHNPVGPPKPPNPTIPGPQMGPTGLAGPVGGALGVPNTAGLPHGPGMIPTSLTSGLGPSSQVTVLIFFPQKYQHAM